MLLLFLLKVWYEITHDETVEQISLRDIAAELKNK